MRGKVIKMFNVFLVDNYDSFSFNLVDYFRRLDSDVIVYRNKFNVNIIDKKNPDLIVLSPGPSTPKNSGNLLKVIDKYHKKYPIFGICLGHQAIVEYFGGELDLLDYPYHGKQSLIEHDGKTIYNGIPNPFPAGRYHSLTGKNIPDCLEVTATYGDIVMGVRHKKLKIEGVQFHPESILTFQNGPKIIRNVISYVKSSP